MDTLRMIVNTSKGSDELEERLKGMRKIYQSQISHYVNPILKNKAIEMYGLVNHLIDAFWYVDLVDLENQKAWILNKIEQYENFIKK